MHFLKVTIADDHGRGFVFIDHEIAIAAAFPDGKTERTGVDQRHALQFVNHSDMGMPVQRDIATAPFCFERKADPFALHAVFMSVAIKDLYALDFEFALARENGKKIAITAHGIDFFGLL